MDLKETKPELYDDLVHGCASPCRQRDQLDLYFFELVAIESYHFYTCVELTEVLGGDVTALYDFTEIQRYEGYQALEEEDRIRALKSAAFILRFTFAAD